MAAENVATIVNAVSDKLPSKNYNIKHVLIKKTMGPVFKVEGA